MAKTTNKPFKAALGFQVIETKANFFKFENPGDEFHGIFIEAQERENRKYAQKQIVWTCTDMDGEIVQLAEKTVMSTFRLKLQKGDEFILTYNGEVKTEKSKYKDFTLQKKIMN